MSSKKTYRGGGGTPTLNKEATADRKHKVYANKPGTEGYKKAKAEVDKLSNNELARRTAYRRDELSDSSKSGSLSTFRDGKGVTPEQAKGWNTAGKVASVAGGISDLVAINSRDEKVKNTAQDVGVLTKGLADPMLNVKARPEVPLDIPRGPDYAGDNDDLQYMNPTLNEEYDTAYSREGTNKSDIGNNDKNTKLSTKRKGYRK